MQAQDVSIYFVTCYDPSSECGNPMRSTQVFVAATPAAAAERYACEVIDRRNPGGRSLGHVWVARADSVPANLLWRKYELSVEPSVTPSDDVRCGAFV